MLGLPAASEPCRVWLRLPGRFRGPPHGSAGRSPVRSCVSAGARLPPCAQSEVSSVPFCLPCWHAAVCRPHTLNSTSTSKSFQSTVTGELNAPYSKQFVHSKSSQYRKMKTEWKSNVYLARSRIQVSGNFVLRNGGGGGTGPGGREAPTCGVRMRASCGCRSRIPFSTPHPISLVWDAGDAAAGWAPLGGTALGALGLWRVH